MEIPLNYIRLIHSLVRRLNFLRMLQRSTILHWFDACQGRTILDIGAGSMSYSIALSRRNNIKVIAVDLLFTPEDELFARRNTVEALIADACVLPLRNSSVDCILMSSLLQMVSEPIHLLRECLRVLRPSGYIVLSVPNHYQFIPKFMGSSGGHFFMRLFGLPHSSEELVGHLNKRFNVAGPKGYYSEHELKALLVKAGFRITDHKYAPGRFGSLLWELSVLAYVKCGKVAFHLLFLSYPLAWLFDLIFKPTVGSEHIVRIEPINEH